MTGPSTGSLLTNEQVLEKLFRAGYSKWVEDARKRLGPDAAAAAPRVVSKAFAAAWSDRQRIRTEGDLEAFLGANVQHGVAREQSRRAKPKMGAFGGQKDATDQDKAGLSVDEAWKRLQQTLAGASSDAAHREAAKVARHGAAEHMSSLGKTGSLWKKLVGVAVGAGALWLALWYANKAGEARAIVHALNAPDVRNYATSYGQQANVTLDDGTVVLLGADSKLSVPKEFGPSMRAVRLAGSANFKVSDTQSNPFTVLAGETKLNSTGAEFTATRFTGDSATVVRARKGTVDVTLLKAERQVAEGFNLLVTDAGEMRVPSTEELDEATAWVDGSVSIVGSLRYALPRMRRWFGLDIRIRDSSLLDRNVFIRSPMQSQKQAIENVEQSGSMKFTYVGDYMGFKDAPAAATKTKTKTKGQ